MTEAEHTTAGEKKRRVRSTFVLAAVLFVALNGMLSFLTPIAWDQYKFPYAGWAWWTMHDLRKDRALHNVCLLGSSLMVSAISNCDANYLNQKLDMTAYHKASYLDHLLRTKFGGSFDTYNMAAPGQMPSDAYLALRAMVEHGNRPDVVIYGLAPRDFIDSTLKDPADTEQFKYLKRMVNFDTVATHYFRSPFAKLDWWLQREVYLYGYALDFQMAVNQTTTKVMAYLVPQPKNDPAFTWWDRVRLMPRYLAAEIHPEAMMISPVDKRTAFNTFVDNTKEYQDRYRSPDRHTYRTQMLFLKKISEYCRKERIELVLANMPVTLYNASMLPPGEYVRYVQGMRDFAITYDVTFYDLSNFVLYPQCFFHDGVHMNAFGGARFVENLVAAIAADHRASSAMAMAGQELERHSMIARLNKNDKINKNDRPL